MSFRPIHFLVALIKQFIQSHALRPFRNSNAEVQPEPLRVPGCEVDLLTEPFG